MSKFVDCAVTVGADFLVSEDRDFRLLSHIDSPKIKLLRKDEFLRLPGSLGKE